MHIVWPSLARPCTQADQARRHFLLIVPCNIVFRVRIVLTVAFEERPLAEQGDHSVIAGIRRNLASRFAFLMRVAPCHAHMNTRVSTEQHNIKSSRKRWRGRRVAMSEPRS